MARPSGAKVWIYRFRDPAGKMAQLLIGSFPALSLADARSEWRNHRATRDKHGDPRDEVRRRQEAAKVAAIRGKGYTLTRAAESYQKEHLSKLARGDEQWRILEREILPEIGSVLLADLKPSQVMAAVVPMRKRAPRVAAMGISALRGVIRHARSMNRLDLDVADSTAGIPTIPQGKRSRALSDPEISLLLRWLDSGAVSRTIVDVLRLTLYTGARSGEVCAMRSRDVDIDAKTWTHTQGTNAGLGSIGCAGSSPWRRFPWSGDGSGSAFSGGAAFKAAEPGLPSAALSRPFPDVSGGLDWEFATSEERNHQGKSDVRLFPQKTQSRPDAAIEGHERPSSLSLRENANGQSDLNRYDRRL